MNVLEFVHFLLQLGGGGIHSMTVLRTEAAISAAYCCQSLRRVPSL